MDEERETAKPTEGNGETKQESSVFGWLYAQLVHQTHHTQLLPPACLRVIYRGQVLVLLNASLRYHVSDPALGNTFSLITLSFSNISFLPDMFRKLI